MMLEKLLQDIGLSGYEAKIYVALLNLGEATSGQILDEAGLRTGKVYELLNSLVKKGFVSQVTKSGVKYFSPANPGRILEYLEERKHDIEGQEKQLNEIIPEINKKIRALKSPTHIEVFVGLKGWKSAYSKELLFAKKSSTVYVMGVMHRQKYSKHLYDFFVHTHQPRRERIVAKTKKLYSEDARGTEDLQEKSAEIRYLPYNTLVSINVVENLSIIGIASEEPIAIAIENEEVAKSFVRQFEILWSIAKK